MSRPAYRTSDGARRALSVIHVNDIAFVGSTLVNGLRSAGVDAELWDPPKPMAGRPYPLKAASLPLRAGVMAVTGARLRLRSPDVVHLHYATQVPAAVLSGRPFIVHCHGSDIRSVRATSRVGRLMASLFARAAGVVVATPDLLPIARELRSDAAWIPNPLDTGQFTPSGVPRRDVLVGTRLSEIKGVDTAIEVVRSVRAMRPATSITIVDHGPELARMAEAAGPDARIIPPLAHPAMPGLYRDHRIAIGQFALGVASQYELESMACGTPVAAAFHFADAYDEPPPIVHGPTPQAMAEQIVAHLDNEVARASAASLGRAWVVGHHDRTVVVARHIASYHEILRGR